MWIYHGNINTWNANDDIQTYTNGKKRREQRRQLDACVQRINWTISKILWSSWPIPLMKFLNFNWMIIKLMWLWWHQQQPQQDFSRIMWWWWCELNSNWTLSILLTFWISTQYAHAHLCLCVYDITWWIFALLSYARTCFCWRLQHIAWMWSQIYAYRFWFFFLNFEWHISFKWLEIFDVMKFSLRFDAIGLSFMLSWWWCVICHSLKHNITSKCVWWRSHILVFDGKNFWIRKKKHNE